MFRNHNTSKIAARNSRNPLEISQKTEGKITQIAIYIDADPELGQKIIENIQQNIWLRKCKNCDKLFIVNSATHEICWRCREKDRLESKPVEL